MRQTVVATAMQLFSAQCHVYVTLEPLPAESYMWILNETYRALGKLYVEHKIISKYA